MDTAVTIAFYRYCRILCGGHHHIIVLGLGSVKILSQIHFIRQ